VKNPAIPGVQRSRQPGPTGRRTPPSHKTNTAMASDLLMIIAWRAHLDHGARLTSTRGSQLGETPMSTEDSEAAEPLRAVAYVRMSTDRQIYSTENQMEAIAAYAARKNIAIVRIYKDDGKSGLMLDRRPALKSLLGDVMLGKADFDCILVYDVSRWGRFQNSDESAHYEFICKEAGVRVEYCAEEFSNDGSQTPDSLHLSPEQPCQAPQFRAAISPPDSQFN